MTDEEEKTSIHRPHKPATDNERTVVAGAPRQVARLRATLEDGMQTFLPLSATPVALTIGRDPTCGWYLQDLSVSRKHATIRWSGIALSIEDHGSSGGTFVGGRAVGATPCLVRPGDSVRVGDAVFVLELTSHASAEVEQTRMVANPHPMSEKVTPAPSRPRTPVPATAAAFEVSEVTVLPLGDDDATAAEVQLPAVVAGDATADEVRLPAAVPESRPQHGKATTPPVTPARPVPPAKAAPAKAAHVQVVPSPKPAPARPVAQAKPVAPPIKAVAPAMPRLVESEQQTTEAEIPLPESVPWNSPPAAKNGARRDVHEVKTEGAITLPPERPALRSVAAEMPRTEAEIHLPPAQQRTATHPVAVPANQQATEAQILLPEAKPRVAQPATEAEVRLPEAARPTTASMASPRARDAEHDPPVYVPERDVLAPGEETRSWALEAALAKPPEGIFGTRRPVVKSGMPAKKDAKGKPVAASSSKRRRILLIAGPALLAIVTSASAWLQGPEAGAAPGQQKAATSPAGPQAPRTPPRQATAAHDTTAARDTMAREPAGHAPGMAAGAPDPAAAASDPAAAAAAQDELLAGAIRAYSDGNRTEALSIFKRIGNSDPTAKAMVHIITLQASEAQ